LVVGADVEQIAQSEPGQFLISIPIFVDVTASRTEVRYHAAYLAAPSGNGYALINLDTGTVVAVPLERLDFIAADPAGVLLLLRQSEGSSSINVTVAVPTGAVDVLPDGTTEPTVPGDWDRSIFATRIGRSCTGISPQQTYIACFKDPTLAKYLAGDWQIDIRRYGVYESHREIYRGAGAQPVFGFTLDDSWLYFQNETGVWREPMSLDMFD
ncbi:MAG: hypothetical protein WKF81_13115, partial [Thermomicrobiales bacterium]